MNSSTTLATGRIVGSRIGPVRGMLEQRQGAQRDHARRRFVAGLQHDHAVHHRGLAVQLARCDVVDQSRLIKSSPGSRSFRSTGVRRCTQTYLPTAAAFSSSSTGSRVRPYCSAGSTHGPRRGLRATSEIASDGTGRAKSRTRSAGGPAGIMSSRNPSTSPGSRGIGSARRKVRSRVIIRRNRSCSGRRCGGRSAECCFHELALHVVGKSVRGQPRIGQRRPDVFVAADQPRRLMPPQDHLQAVGCPPSSNSAAASAGNRTSRGTGTAGRAVPSPECRGRRHCRSSNRQPAAIRPSVETALVTVNCRLQ